MGSTSRKMHSRRRLAAITFLSNISLDGTHRDTNLNNLNFNHPKSYKSEYLKPKEIHFSPTKSNKGKKFHNSEFFEYEETKSQQKYRDEKNCDRFDEQQPKSRDRVQKFMNDAKARLCNLSQRRKSLQKSLESYSLGKSLESLGCRKSSLCPSECSAAEIKFLKDLKNRKNEGERIILLSKTKSPIVLFSIVPYSRILPLPKVDMKLDMRVTSIRQLSVIADDSLLGIEKPKEGQDISYGELLVSSSEKMRSDSGGELEIRFPYSATHYVQLAPLKSLDDLNSNRHQVYHPNLIDDPELIAGKHSTLLVFDSYITSIIDYVKPSDLKKDLNIKFRERFPNIQLSLSKIRSLKREMYKIARVECNMDLVIVAQAFVYFEKLVLKVLVNKQNRKLCAGACLLLSAKLNDIRGSELQNLVEKIETIFRVNRKDLMYIEFWTLVALDFSLLLSVNEILPHYQRLLYIS